MSRLRQRNVSLYFLASFAATFLLSATILRLTFPRSTPVSNASLPDYYDSGFEKAFPGPWVYSHSQSPSSAKTRQLFWARQVGSRKGIALSSTLRDKIFEEIFPGYAGLVAGDTKFWASYFKLKFSASAYAPSLNDHASNIAVYFPFSACFDLYKRFGADIVVIGNSETFSGLVPAQISEGLRSFFSDAPRVLFCTAPGMPLFSTYDIVSTLQRLNPVKPKLLLVGLSYWQAYFDSAVLKTNRNTVLDEIDNFARASPEAIHYSWLSRYFGLGVSSYFEWFTWDLLVPPFLTSSTTRAPSSNNVSRSYYKHRNDPEQLAREFEAHESTFAPLEGFESKYCADDQFDRTFELGLRTLEKFANKTFIFIPATTRRHQSLAPCLFQKVKSRLDSVSTLNIATHAVKSSELGLDYTHFLHLGDADNERVIDLNHANYLGASKQTEQLVKRINLLFGVDGKTE